jgi:hypothetical protein
VCLLEEMQIPEGFLLVNAPPTDTTCFAYIGPLILQTIINEPYVTPTVIYPIRTQQVTKQTLALTQKTPQHGDFGVFGVFVGILQFSVCFCRTMRFT